MNSVEPQSVPEASPPPEQTVQVRKKPRFEREFFEFVKLVALFLILFGALRTFVIEGYQVLGPSMEPTLLNHDRILVLKLPHQLSEWGLLGGYNPIGEGDIVVFRSVEDEKKRYVKRVVAKGPKQRGKTVQAGPHGAGPRAVSVRIEEGVIFVNNRRLKKDYVDVETRSRHGSQDNVLVQPGEYFVLGDNRGESKDSRDFGPVDDDKMIGTALLRFWPPSRIGLVR